jgi:alanyl-tRNA synthetase
MLGDIETIAGVPVLVGVLAQADADTLREMADRFRQKIPSGVAVLGAVRDGKPAMIACVTDDLVKRGLNAGSIVRQAASAMGGSGGGKPNLAQAGGKEPSRLPDALAAARELVAASLA